MISRSRYGCLDANPVQWTGVRWALVAALDGAECMEGDQQRKTETGSGRCGCPGRHPKVRMHEVGTLKLEHLGEAISEGAHVGP
jgi:hypothetical protein